MHTYVHTYVLDFCQLGRNLPSKLRINGWRMCIHTLPTIQLFKKLSVVRGMYKFGVPVYCSVMLHYQNTLGVEIHTDMWRKD